MTDINFDSDPDKPFIPEIKKEKTYNLDEANYKSKLDQLADQNGFIKTRLNEEVIIQRISHDLYKNPESALRELYNNELRACLIAKSKYKTDPYIKVSLNTIDRKLIIQGFNSLGITEDIFCKILTELGTSSNHDRKTIGQFGMGFASYTKLSDLMIVETKCIENEDHYSVIAKNGLGFEKLPKTNLEQTGTKLSLTIRDHEDLNEVYKDLISMLESISKYSNIKTYLELKTEEKIITHNNSYESGLVLLDQTSLKQEFENDVKELKENKDYSVIDYSFENEDLEFYVCFRQSNGSDYSYNRSSDDQTYLINTPIEIDLDYLTDFYSLVVNLKDELKFKPMPDRERLTKEAEQKLKSILTQKIKEAFKITSCHTLNDWYDHDHKWFIASSSDQIKELLDPETKKLNQILNVSCQEKYAESSRRRQSKTKIKYLLDKLISKTNLFYIDKRDKRKYDTLDLWFEAKEQSYFITIINPKWFEDRYNENDPSYDQTIRLLKQYGFKSAKDYIKDNKIKLAELEKSNSDDSDQTNSYQDITLYYSYEYNDHYRDREIKVNTRTLFKDNLESLDLDKVIIVKGFNTYRNILKQFQTDCIFTDRYNANETNDTYYLTGEKPHTKNLNFKTIKDLESDQNTKRYYTNFGFKSLAKIKKIIYSIKKGDPIRVNLIEYKDTITNRLLSYIDFNTSHTNLYVIGSKLDLFRLALILTSYDLPKDKLDLDYDPLDKSYGFGISEKIKEAINKMNEKFTNEIKDKTLINSEILNHYSYQFDQTLEYFTTLKEIEKQIKDPSLIKLFMLSQNEDNFKEICEDVLRLQRELIK